MKKTLAILGAALMFSCAQQKEDVTPELKLNVSNSEAQKVYLIVQNQGVLDTVGRGELLEGKATIAYTLENPQLLFVAFDEGGRPLQIFANTEGFTADVDFASMPPVPVVTNNTFHASFENYQKIEENFSADIQKLEPLYNAAQGDEVLTKVMLAKQDSMMNWFTATVLDFCKKNQVVGALIANQRLPMAEYEDLKNVYDNTNVAFQNAPAVVALKQKLDLMKTTAIGQPYVEFSGNDTTGTIVNITDFQKGKKLMLIDFWASWCAPCRKANPALVSIYNDYKEKGFEIVGVSLDDNLDKWKQAIVADDLTWPQISDLKGWQSEYAALYGIKAIPQSVIVNEYGVIVVKNLNEVDLRAYLEENL